MLENRYISGALHGAVGSAAGSHFGVMLGQGETKFGPAIAMGAGTAVGTYLDEEDLVQSGVAGAVAATTPYFVDKVAKTPKTKAAVAVFMGALGACAGAYVSQKLL